MALLARNEVGLVAAKRKLAEAGGEAFTLTADVTDREALTAAVEEAAAAMGGLDVVVTAAAGLSFGRFTETDPDDFDATVDTVLGGTVNTIRAALPHLERSHGAVVVLGSIAGHMPLPGMAAYTASKHGLVGFLETARVELEESGSSVTLSLVNPGAVDTPLWSNVESSTGLLPRAPQPDAVLAGVGCRGGRRGGAPSPRRTHRRRLRPRPGRLLLSLRRRDGGRCGRWRGSSTRPGTGRPARAGSAAAWARAKPRAASAGGRA